MYNIMEENLRVLKLYVKFLADESYINHNLTLAKHYYIVLHNFIIIESMYKDDVILHNKEINKHLNLKELNNVRDIYTLFIELYNVYHIVRNNVETLDSIDSVKEFLIKNTHAYSLLM